MRAEYTCPDCLEPTDRMPVLSAMSADDFYLCRTCKHVSTASKDGLGVPVPAQVTGIAQQDARDIR